MPGGAARSLSGGIGRTIGKPRRILSRRRLGDERASRRRGVRERPRHHADRARQLLGVGRVGRVTGALQAFRIGRRILRVRDGVRVAATAQQLREVAERVRVRTVRTELLDGAHGGALHELGRRGGDRRAAPAPARFHAEQVVALGAARRPRLALAPAGFQSGLRDQELRGNAERCRSFLGVRPQLLDERLDRRGCTHRRMGRQRRLRRIDLRLGWPGWRSGGRGDPLRELAFERLAQADAACRKMLRDLLVEHRRVGAHRVRVERPILGQRLAHLLQHHVEEQRLELAGGLGQRLLGRLARLAAKAGERVRVQRERLCSIGGGAANAHQMISSSALSAPAERIACKIASRSPGVAPSVLSAFTTSASFAPAGSATRPLPSCFTCTSARSVTTVWPCENGAGWLMMGSLLIVTVRLPCATAQASIVTDWFMTIEPVRALMITFAAGSETSTPTLSSSATNATRASFDTGARTRMTRPSTAVASGAPKRRLIASTVARATPKSLSRSSSCTKSRCPSAVSTARSTVPPPGMRPAFSWLICVLLPPDDAPAPATATLPCAIA